MADEQDKLTTDSLMKGIRNEIQAGIERGDYSSNPPRFPEVLPHSMIRAQKYDAGEEFKNLEDLADLPVEGLPIHSHRKFLGWLIIGVKKFFRYWTRKYSDAVFARQTNFNLRVTDILFSMKERIEYLERRQEELEKKIQDNKSQSE